jgi:hypothetical protein
LRETLDKRRADAGAAAGDQDCAILKIRKLRLYLGQIPIPPWIVEFINVPLFGTKFDYVELSDYPSAMSRT